MLETGSRILVIDDEPQIRRLLKVALAAHGFEMAEAALGREGLTQAAMSRPDLIILDMGLPDMDGLEVLKQLREWSQTPVIVLSVKEQEETKIAMLDAGAEDYVTKPFGMGELLARIRAALRRSLKEAAEEAVLTLGDLRIDRVKRLVTVAEQPVKLTPTEYDILKTLASNPGRVFTNTQLLKAVWGAGYQNETHYLRVFVGQLRRKIEQNPSRPIHLITEPGVGYRLM
ncbi:two-component system KDP operon response regulator KdpE [Hydrogenispora ethanolica]|jgi:two-component system KDP operon response regulator KdpE|uniref:Two-component system KDP operon response regulator KdpE n=1 Tax=Hydrogenispora ethanolica TaxID=1082276 RepID=A0A4R1S7E6_HYDET|nr:response regulator [Hydrogenispora ethanolica]TCL75305.1 two-component system KDP operon response regulator KdpE [Hydrogenispora ethanolica]